MKANPYLVFDIETRALPLSRIKEKGLMPSFKAPSNYKDPDKIAAKEAEHESEIMAKAALDATLSEVCAIGIKREHDEAPIIMCNDGFDPKRDERLMLIDFWSYIRESLNDDARIVGFNIYGFDLPYLIRRSWHHGITPVAAIRKGRYWNDHHVYDLAEVWKLGDKNNFISLDRISRFFGLGQKSGSGKDFAALLDSDKEAAYEYLRKDIQLTEKLAFHLGIIE